MEQIELLLCVSLSVICNTGSRTTTKLFLVLSLMLPQTISRPGSFTADIAGDDDSFKVVCFDVIFYATAHPFLSTYFANES